MAIKPYLLESRRIVRVSRGFYKGFNGPVAFGSMALVSILILWIIIFPHSATAALSAGKDLTLRAFRAWYVYALAGFVLFSLVIVALPASGRIKLGPDDAEPQFSTLSWLSMMFCAGIGAGVLIYAVGEPLSHLGVNPKTFAGTINGGSAEAAPVALSYTYLHWGLSAWSCYAVLGLAIALFSYRYGMPLTIRTALAPILGSGYGRMAGNMIDIFSIFAIIVGVATTLGYGVAQFVSGAQDVTGVSGLAGARGEPSVAWQLVALAFAAIVATGSVVSGVGRGIKWLSNLSTILFFVVLLAFAAVGQTWVSVERYGTALWGYVSGFLDMATLVAHDDTPLAEWQTDWTIFYWTWWIAFAPFVAQFLARISRGRSLRSFVIGCMFAPVGICTVWFAFVGGAALDLQLDPAHGGQLAQAPVSAQIYQTFRALTGPNIAAIGNTLIALLLMMLLITTLNAAILSINTIAAAGDENRREPVHIVLWGLAVTLIIGGLVAAGGTASIRDAMIIGALPFSFVIALSSLSVAMAVAFEIPKMATRPPAV